MGKIKTNKPLQMKFALLVASAAAIKVEADRCVSAKEARAIFGAIDTNDNGQVGRRELVRALRAFARSRDYTPTKQDWEWVRRTATADAGADHTLSEAEFARWVEQFARHFHIDGC